jgi:hypothetical protein
MPNVAPRTGSPTYESLINQSIHHTRNAPYNQCITNPCNLQCGTTVTITEDHQFPTWVYIRGAGVTGWVGKQHVSAQALGVFAQFIAQNAPSTPLPLPYGNSMGWLNSSYPCIKIISAQVTTMGFTHTYTQPSFQSAPAMCVVPTGYSVVVTGMTMDNEWLRLDTGTWIPRNWAI